MIFNLTALFLSGYYQPAGPLITAAPLHGGFKDGGAPPPLPTEQTPQFSRYSYAQPQQVSIKTPSNHPIHFIQWHMWYEGVCALFNTL